MALRNIGPIEEAELSFGDLTVLVGPQASGKSIALQFLKLVLDRWPVLEQLRQYGIDWSGSVEAFIDAYFGEGMHSIWGSESHIELDDHELTIKHLSSRRGGKQSEYEQVFMIPAQRVLALRNGWPRPFADYASGDPYVVRDYSEKLRRLVELEFGSREQLFPQKGRLKSEIRDLLNEHVFGNFELKVDKVASQKRLVLKRKSDPLPHMVWSAGQREFVPLLLGLYWLMPSTRTTTRERIKWVVLEELEMGLHPRALSVALLMVLELVARGYRVCLSTHASQVLETVWAIRNLQEIGGGAPDLLGIFKCKVTQQMRRLAEDVLAKDFKVYYFGRDSRRAIDISNLDPAGHDKFESHWGGLAEFSARVNETIANAVANAESAR